MSSYYPIPPDFKVNPNDIYSPTVKSSITIANLPNNALISSLGKANRAINFYVYQLKNHKWLRISKEKCNPFESIEYSREDILPGSSEQLVVFASQDELPKICQVLPKPSSLRLDKSPIAERASYNFYLNKSSTSFQGEYPLSMSQKVSGDFFSTDALKLNYNSNSFTHILFINLKRNASSSEKKEIDFISPNDNKKLSSFHAKENEISDYFLDNNKSFKFLFMRCKDAVFMPLFISIRNSEGNDEITVEHTHPPHEMFWGRDKYKLLLHMKSRWNN